MTLTVKNLLHTLRYATMFSAMVVVWLVLGMLYLDHFFKPFDRLVPILMPWKAYEEIPEGSTTETLIALMEDQLAASNKAAVYSFATMAGSFTMLCIYLTFVYQQKQRRARESELFLLKNREVERRNEFIRYISATISHEFKNNLGRIKRRIDLLSELPDDAKRRIDDNLDKLFADIEIFKKISDERETALIKFEKVDLRSLLTEMAEQYSDFAEVSLTGEMASSSIFASQTLLKTVFENLFDNAIKYKKPEQKRARISIASAQDIDQKRRYLSLLFRDEGIGMDEQEVDRCFYKGKGSREGWGQGLYFIKYVIGLHAGKIRVGKEYTAPGTGTEIIINLPFVEEALDV